MVSFYFLLALDGQSGFALFVFLGLAYLIYWILSGQKSWVSWTAYLNFVICSALGGMLATAFVDNNDSIRLDWFSYIVMLVILAPLLGFINFVLWSAHDKPKE